MQISGGGCCSQNCVEGFLKDAGFHPKTGCPGQSTDLQQDADPSEADKKGAQKELVFFRQSEDSIGQLQKADQDSTQSSRDQRKEPTPQKS